MFLKIFILLLFSPLILFANVFISAQKAVALLQKPNVVFVSSQSAEAFKKEHIIFSKNIDLAEKHFLNLENCSNFICLEEVKSFLSLKGIKREDTLIIYDAKKRFESAGLYLFFKTLGHKKLFILDGGYEALQAIDPNQEKVNAYDEKISYQESIAKVAEESIRAYEEKKSGLSVVELSLFKQQRSLASAMVKELLKQRAPFYNRLYVRAQESEEENSRYEFDKTEVDLGLFVTKEDVIEATKNHTKLLDVRAFEELGIKKIKKDFLRMGYIPTASFVVPKSFFSKKVEKTFKEQSALRAPLVKQEVLPNDNIYIYGNSVFSKVAFTLLALKESGMHKVKIYYGGWVEWSNDLSLEVAR